MFDWVDLYFYSTSSFPWCLRGFWLYHILPFCFCFLLSFLYSFKAFYCDVLSTSSFQILFGGFEKKMWRRCSECFNTILEIVKGKIVGISNYDLGSQSAIHMLSCMKLILVTFSSYYCILKYEFLEHGCVKQLHGSYEKK